MNVVVITEGKFFLDSMHGNFQMENETKRTEQSTRMFFFIVSFDSAVAGSELKPDKNGNNRLCAVNIFHFSVLSLIFTFVSVTVTAVDGLAMQLILKINGIQSASIVFETFDFFVSLDLVFPRD